jgi:acetoacetyl-CoA reductase/3-oxoacyl-[acyl-carrier protein] reductase
VLRVNLDSAFHLLRSAAPRLREGGGGSVVLISSINGERGKFGQANYAASKAGLIGLGRTAARELGSFGVRVNVVAPGLVETRMTETMPEEFKRRAIAETVLGRAATPTDVAHAVLFLCSDMSRHVTGQILRVDGGQLMA